jgi:hypothetical protein
MREQENYVLSRCASILTQERKSLLPTNNDRFDDDSLMGWHCC